MFGRFIRAFLLKLWIVGKPDHSILAGLWSLTRSILVARYPFKLRFERSPICRHKGDVLGRVLPVSSEGVNSHESVLAKLGLEVWR